MKKLNNKGFAVTTIVYGISIMAIMIIAILMAIMSTTLTNNKELAKEIERELNNFSKAENSFNALENETNHAPIPQEFIVPEGETGWYRIELWGTQGGGNGGYGAYTSGIIKLNEGDKIYFYVGKHQGGAASGRETDVRIQSGDYNGTSSETRIMVAAGGGSNPGASGGTLKGYVTGMNAQGGSLKSAKDGSDFSLSNQGTNGSLVGYPETYESAAIQATNQLSPGASPNSSVTNNNGGGDGYVPGETSASGGVSFIAGYAGSYAYNATTVSQNPKVTILERDYYFVDGIMLPGVNQGDGRAKIERITSANTGTAELKANANFKGIKYIRDCNSTNPATKISVIKDGIDLAYEKELTNVGSCKQLNLSTVVSPNDIISEVAVWHKDGTDLKNHTISVCNKANCTATSAWKYIKGPSANTEYSETETVTGVHISAYQPDYTKDLPKRGTYYILPVLYENKAMTVQSDLNSTIKADFLTGTKQQKWSIEVITGKPKRKSDGTIVTEKEYKISELGRYKVMAIAADQNLVGNELVANQVFNTKARNEPQIWKIKALGNGTYTISTVVEPRDSTFLSGNILPIPYPTNSDIDAKYQNTFIIGKNNDDTQRFKLISLEYSN